jgi:hypothetical protein
VQSQIRTSSAVSKTGSARTSFWSTREESSRAPHQIRVPATSLYSALFLVASRLGARAVLVASRDDELGLLPPRADNPLLVLPPIMHFVGIATTYRSGCGHMHARWACIQKIRPLPQHPYLSSRPRDSPEEGVVWILGELKSI